jgi:hypothetical protein
MAFLPNDYKTPETAGKFMKFKEAETRFRILSPEPLLGYVGWTSDGNKRKPVRKPMGAKWTDSEVDDNKTRHFWAMAVWSYATSRVMVLEVTQTTIQKSIETFSKDGDYGDPVGYDIVVKKSGEGMDTEYQVMPKPPKKADKAILSAWDALQEKFDLSRLFSNGDPFGEDMLSGNGQHDELNPPPIGDDDLPF